MEDQTNYFLITKALSHPEDAALQTQLNYWRKMNAENEDEYQTIKHIWEQSAQLEENYTGRNIDQVVSAFSVRLEDKISSEKALVKTYRLWWRSAAAILLFGLAGIWSYNELKTETFVYRSTNDQRDSVFLADGSKVYLNKHTQIKYSNNFNKDKRNFFLLKGEAFFDITKDSSHPFMVMINKSIVKVLGTTFNIQNIDSTIAVEVKTGKIMFETRNNDTPHILEKGMAVTYDQKTGVVKKFLEQDKQTNSNWLYKELNFVDATLPEVCALIEKQYDVTIKIEGNISNIKKLNANFKNDPLEDVLDVLKMTYKISIEHHNNHIIIKQ